MDKALLEAMSPTPGNLSEPARGGSDCRHLLKPFRKKKASRALARTAMRSIPLYRPSPLSVQWRKKLPVSSLDKVRETAKHAKFVRSRSPRRMANFMDRYRGGNRHYADVECAYGELERYLVLSFNALETRTHWKQRKATKFGGLSIRRGFMIPSQDRTHAL